VPQFFLLLKKVVRNSDCGACVLLATQAISSAPGMGSSTGVIPTLRLSSGDVGWGKALDSGPVIGKVLAAEKKKKKDQVRKKEGEDEEKKRELA